MIDLKDNFKNLPGFFDFKKAMIAADGIRHTFTLERGVDLHSDQWDHIVYHLIKDALLEYMDIFLAPNYRPYLKVYVPSKEEIEAMTQDSEINIKISSASTQKESLTEGKITYKNFGSICLNAVENYAGLALFSQKHKTEPDMIVRFGALYSYLQHGDFGGPPQLVDNMIKAIKLNPLNPKQAVVDPADTSFDTGEPSEEFFDNYMRTLIQQELKALLDNKELDVTYHLRKQHMYALCHILIINMSHEFKDTDQQHRIMQYLTWYMPLYLSLGYESEDGGIDIYN